MVVYGACDAHNTAYVPSICRRPVIWLVMFMEPSGRDTKRLLLRRFSRGPIPTYCRRAYVFFLSTVQYLAGGLVQVGVHVLPFRAFLLFCFYRVHKRGRHVIGQYHTKYICKDSVTDYVWRVNWHASVSLMFSLLVCMCCRYISGDLDWTLGLRVFIYTMPDCRFTWFEAQFLMFLLGSSPNPTTWHSQFEISWTFGIGEIVCEVCVRVRKLTNQGRLFW